MAEKIKIDLWQKLLLVFFLLTLLLAAVVFFLVQRFIVRAPAEADLVPATVRQVDLDK